MKDVTDLLFDLLTTLAKLLPPGAGPTVIAENLLLKQQLIIHSGSRQLKQHKPRYECPRIAKQINLAFGLGLDMGTVRRKPAAH